MSSIIEKPRFSCALAAQQTVLAIPGAAPIIHAGPGCASKASGFAGVQAGQQGEGYAGRTHVSCTNAGEKEVVFGGEKNLEELVSGALQVVKADLFVILSGCTAGIIGDDSAGVAGRFARNGDPVVGVDTAGFRGNNYFGHEVVVKAIIDQYVGKVEPLVEKGLVNLWASVPFQDAYWRGDLENLKGVLEKLGLKVNVLFGPSSEGVSEWKTIPNAQFNLLVGPWVGLSIVKHLEKKYGTPYFHYQTLPVGAQETSKFLREVGKYADLDAEVVENVIKKEEKRFYDYFISFTDFVAEQRNILPYQLYVVGDSLYTSGITSYLTNELGFLPQGVYIIDDPSPEREEKIKAAFEESTENVGEIIRFEADGGLITRSIQEKIGASKKAIIFGSYWEKNISKETNNYFVNLSLPIATEIITSSSYAGYEGGLHLIEKIYSLAFNRGNLSSRTHVE